MVKKRLIAFLGALLLIGSSIAQAQLNEVKRIPKRGGTDETTKSITDFEKGFWFAAELSAGASVRYGKGSGSNAGFGELDFVFGYRANEHFMIGPGVGARVYFPNDHLRRDNRRWSFPIYLDVRGSFLSQIYRNVVPYYSLDVGATILDGFMWRPTIGFRFGSRRNSFLLGVAYTGQMMKVMGEQERGYISFLSLRLGYQF